MTLPVTGSQTVGPFFLIGMAPLVREDMTGPEIAGERVTIYGRVLDADGAGVPDAQIEIWQADARGRYYDAESGHPGFRGFGRAPTNDRGEFRFTTIKPGCVAGPQGSLQAPHLVVLVFMRGLLRHLLTRVYFADEAAANANDPILKLLPAGRQHTLMARRQHTGDATLTWNIHLQGDDETIFFDL